MTCSEARASVNGFTTALVTKQKNRPKVMEMGRAGSALRQMANSSRVRHSPIRMATKHAIVVFQSP